MMMVIGTLGLIANLAFGLGMDSMVNIFVAGVMVPGLAEYYCDLFKSKSKDETR